MRKKIKTRFHQLCFVSPTSCLSKTDATRGIAASTLRRSSGPSIYVRAFFPSLKIINAQQRDKSDLGAIAQQLNQVVSSAVFRHKIPNKLHNCDAVCKQAISNAEQHATQDRAKLAGKIDSSIRFDGRLNNLRMFGQRCWPSSMLALCAHRRRYVRRRVEFVCLFCSTRNCRTIQHETKTNKRRQVAVIVQLDDTDSSGADSELEQLTSSLDALARLSSQVRVVDLCCCSDSPLSTNRWSIVCGFRSSVAQAAPKAATAGFGNSTCFWCLCICNDTNILVCFRFRMAAERAVRHRAELSQVRSGRYLCFKISF
jgi:hypothetical protein